MSNLVLVAPLDGWSAPLEEVPDPVFAGRLLGDGVAIDPVGATLHAPCDGEVIAIPPQKHAVTLRAANGAHVLVHVGVDTVALNGAAFATHVEVGARVTAGAPLLTFDLDVLAQRAKSVLTPIIVTDEVPFSIVRRTTDRAVKVGEPIMELASAGAGAAATANAAGPGGAHVMSLRVPLEHGLHARPAALLVARIKHLAATVTLAAHGRTASARSAIAIMSLGIRRGDEVAVTAAGPDADAALRAIRDALADAEKEVRDAMTSVGASADVKLAAMNDAPRGREAVATLGAASNHWGIADAASHLDSTQRTLRGVVASPGLAVGTAFQLTRREIVVDEAGRGMAVESARLDAALGAVRRRIVASDQQGPHAEVLAAHLEFLEDPELLAAARDQLARGKSAGFAWRAAVRANVEVLRALPDTRMAERADDLLDIESQVLAALEHDAAAATPPLPERAIVLADELFPSQLIALDAARIAGICTARGGPTSHVAILAAALNIPMLVAAGAAVRDIANGTILVLDADHAVLHVSPSEDERASAESKVARRRRRQAAERAAAQRECRTADGARIEVFANVGSVAEARAAREQGAEGCGLLRTEFLFLERDTPPDEAAQSALYSGIVEAFEGRPVVVRTLDTGGDKPLAYMPLAREENPALGVRGVRVSLLYPHVLRAQLRAILSARPRGRCRILLPMISDPTEVRAIGEMLDDVRRELDHDAAVPLGAMIETPAAAMIADRIAREADFLSIGTNDLTQYALAIDRGNPALAPRLDALHPAVLRLIAKTAEGARANCREVAVCGGLASDPLAAPILIGLGVNELSAVPAVIPRLKALIGTLTLDACRALAQRALEQQTAADVRALVAHTQEPAE
ncbi:MAG TPA: phosphoenolpyruvate--protein phosphotransferase [Steroidobacteraceae bacterium]|nr:phosphoenolpyruvate--protein phosphotransferase [Steroidobacteraceae bacterium]